MRPAVGLLLFYKEKNEENGLHIMCCPPGSFDSKFGSGTENTVKKYLPREPSLSYPKKTKNPNPSPIGNRFGFFLFGGPRGIRTLDLSDANRTLSHADLKEAPKEQNISLRNGKKI